VEPIAYAVAIVGGYLLGAIPSGVLVGRLRGVDPRSGGSGRTGATNALRTLGMGPAAAVLLLDVAKGALAAIAAGWLVGTVDGAVAWGASLGGVAATLGHVRSVFIGFTGGRGVATGGGALLVIVPLAVVAAIAVMLAVVSVTRYVSLGSIVGASVATGTAAVLFVAGWTGIEAVVATALIDGIVTVAHLDNIQRLAAGTERRLGGG
jgi:glycerol-3-phosphate acyltransferase PlsY